MGQSKQLLPWSDGTLLSHVIKTANGSRANHVVIVLGDNEQVHRKAIENLPVSIVVNDQWSKGMGSSLKVGLAEARQISEAAMVMVCDQPFVTSEHLNNIIEHFNKTGQQVVASKYLDTIGVPALFGKTMFDELMKIADDEGARKIIAGKKDVGVILLESGADLDTPEDYRNATMGNGQ